MSFTHRPLSHFSFWVLTVTTMALSVACTSSVPRPKPKSPVNTYQQAKEMFQQGDLDRTVALADRLASAKSNGVYNLEARVLEVVVFTGRMEAAKELADAYQKGSSLAKNPQYVAAFARRRDDTLVSGSAAALNLGRVAIELTSTGTFPRQLTLDAPWPTIEGPTVVAQLGPISGGRWLPLRDQEAAGLDAQREGIDDALAELAGGDRAKALAALTAGPVKLRGLDFAFFLAKKLETGATLFDQQYLDDPDHLDTLTNVAERVADSIEAMLPQKPNKTEKEQLKRLREQIESIEMDIH